LFVVVLGVLLNLVFENFYEDFYISQSHLVRIDVFNNPLSFFQSLRSPDFSFIGDRQVWTVAVTLAIIASLETLLSIEAVDKIDPLKRISPPNRELKAQGVGNLISGLLGGLPVTSVIVRSSANVSSGGNSSLSTVTHGIWLLLAVLFIPKVLNMIPLSALAAILIFTGYKLAKITIFKEQFSKGWDQFIPFIVTVVAIVFTDLLTGILIGIVSSIYFILKNNFHYSIFTIEDEQRHLLRFRKEVNFLNKAYLKQILMKIPNDSALLIDATNSKFIDNDIVDLVNDFIVNATTRGIRVYIKYSGDESKHFFNDIENRKIV
jgi:MFS superfamily sulfate permease-like transporter